MPATDQQKAGLHGPFGFGPIVSGDGYRVLNQGRTGGWGVRVRLADGGNRTEESTGTGTAHHTHNDGTYLAWY